MLVAIHQPEHLPWLGFLDKARRADVLVLLDNVQYRKNYFQNRNRVRTAEGAAWITVPVLSKGSLHQEIRAVQIDAAGRPRWREKYWGTLEQWYRRAAFWDDYAADLHHALWMETTSLAELNGRIVDVLLRAFGIDVTVRRASDLEVSGKRGDLLLDICRRLGADGYLSGVSGREYLDVSAFERAGVGVQFQEFHHPVYRQRYEPFMPCMSSVDLLFNQGPGSADVLRGVGVELMDEVFS